MGLNQIIANVKSMKLIKLFFSHKNLFPFFSNHYEILLLLKNIGRNENLSLLLKEKIYLNTHWLWPLRNYKAYDLPSNKLIISIHYYTYIWCWFSLSFCSSILKIKITKLKLNCCFNIAKNKNLKSVVLKRLKCMSTRVECSAIISFKYDKDENE